MGWGVPNSEHRVLNWEEYIEAAKNRYGRGGTKSVRYLHGRVHKNDLIWTRDTNGIYYLARVQMEWEYVPNQDAIDADIVNLVRCQHIYKMAVDEVPGKIVASFRAPKTIQAIRSHTVATYSKLLWNNYSGEQRYSLDALADANIWAFLDDKSTEDAVAIFLQTRGWLLVPGSRHADTMKYEYVLVHRETHQRAVVQVKSGNTPLNTDEWSRIATEAEVMAILFQSSGNWVGAEHANVQRIDPDTMHEFLIHNRELLPKSIAQWLKPLR